jgi:hypothetical protein
MLRARARFDGILLFMVAGFVLICYTDFFVGVKNQVMFQKPKLVFTSPKNEI